MPKFKLDTLKRLQGTVAALEDAYSDWRPHYQEIAKYLLPRRYVWLAEQSPGLFNGTKNTRGQSRAAKSRNDRILDPTGTKALRDMAAGLLNGITSPARPWLRLRMSGMKYEEQNLEVKAYMDEAARRLLLVLAESNFYNTMAIQFLDLGCFGSSAVLIYEDFDDVVRFYNSPVGEFRFGQDYRRMVDVYSRTIMMTVRQMVQQFGEENIPDKYKANLREGGQRMHEQVAVCHLIEPNTPDQEDSLPARFKFREVYWDKSMTDGHVLAHRGFREKPGAWTRWELTANDPYGTSPAMDALSDIIQLQHETLRKGQALDKMVNPPIVIEGFMANRQSSLLPGGTTVAPSGASFGAKPVYTVNAPLDALNIDRQDLRRRIQEFFHIDLFRMISSLDTVRSATEIDARKEEKLVLLASVLERYENEALDPIVKRVFNIMKRKGLLPEPPADIAPEDVKVEYVSILTDAQRAIGTATIERFLQVYGNTLSIDPSLKATVDMDQVIRDYGDRLSIPATHFNSKEQAQELLASEEELNSTREAALVGKDLTEAARNLGETDVGGGQSAMARLMGS